MATKTKAQLAAPSFAIFVPGDDPEEANGFPHPYKAGGWRFWHANRPPARTAMDVHEADKHVAAEKRSLELREESWERSDTDGFLSQWAHGITANEAHFAAKIASRGGVDLFPGLYERETGKRAPAIILSGEHGQYFAFCDPDTGKINGRFLSWSDTPRGRLYREGFVILGEWAPAKATIRGHGRGLSGNAWACTVRTDGGYPGCPLIL